MVRIGLDVGSTTAKLVVLNSDGNIIFSRYMRHNTRMREVVLSFLHEFKAEFGDVSLSFNVTGSVGMGFSERYSLPFVQEVVAATRSVQRFYPHVKSMIDIGGEDAKVVFFKNGEAVDLRMNGNCAGGTGAFIDQMAHLLGVELSELNQLALDAERIHPIASRCGVFCKTDIQNLIAKNVSKQDIAASIFHAVAVQTISTLAHGYDVESPILFCGGPLTFIPALRNAFVNYLSLSEDGLVLPENGEYFPAIGTALYQTDDEKVRTVSEIIKLLESEDKSISIRSASLPPIFESNDSYARWKSRINENYLERAELVAGSQDAFIGIDSGSTTTKIVVLDTSKRLLFSFYKGNSGNPIKTVAEGLSLLKEKCMKAGTILNFIGGCSTGYGEDLIKTAFNLPHGIVETMAHYMAALHIDENVSFILDIGGQDMKAIFVDNGVVNRIEINEACSSGCGSFIETFAKSLGHEVPDFAELGCQSLCPCDLGTRCTVFMNSKVKQVLREGASINDISAGLAYSVVKNCIHKVLKLNDTSLLGEHIVVQGGTMRNDSIVRALELLTGHDVSRCDCPELMGAYGCALYAYSHKSGSVSIDDLLKNVDYKSHLLNCKGCENQCLVQCYIFEEGRKFYSGNRCEKVFCNSNTSAKFKGKNAYKLKNNLLFDRVVKVDNPKMVIGIPRILNMYEEYPFWHTLFTSCGIDVRLSSLSNYSEYEKSVKMVMSDNICFPAKLAHSHIEELVKSDVDRIFIPFVVYEHQNKTEQNSYNCPIVTGYSNVIKSVHKLNIPIDSPVFGFKDYDLLRKQCMQYLSSLGIEKNVISKAFENAIAQQDKFYSDLAIANHEILNEALSNNEFCILLAGRPYHSDELIQHKVSDMLSDMGIHIITDDIVRNSDIDIKDTHFLSQWSYPNRIMKAAKWSCSQSNLVQFVEITSFGCGPDAFITDEVRNLLYRNGRTYTLLKLDDINNVGSMKLRVRSLIESLRYANEQHESSEAEPFVTTPIYDEKYRNRKIIVPYFTSYISPLIPSIFKVAGYDVETLPLSDESSAEWGLKFANNEVCYPATLVIGDIVKAFKSGKYDPSCTAVAITQTGGQCRASNYLPMLKKALIDAGYTDVPVISISTSAKLENLQPAFKINWLKILPVALRAILYGDCISRFYHASVVRETAPGEAKKLKDKYLNIGCDLIESGRSKDLFNQLKFAAREFNSICLNKECAKVGIVGEIYLKFNPFAQRNLLDWLISQGVEVAPPNLIDFFMQSFVNSKANRDAHLSRKSVSDIFEKVSYRWVNKFINAANSAASEFKYFTPFGNIWDEASEAKNVVSLNAQFGEGWLLPAEIISYVRSGVRDVISLQPFGCIANHIVSKGVEKRIKELYPEINLLSLDFDSGVSDTNIINRMLLFIDRLKKS